MSRDPILEEAYAAKEALAAKYNFDLHALAEAYRHSPAWVPKRRPARPISSAQARLRRLTDPGDEIRELRKIKEKNAAENDFDVHKIAQAVRKFSGDHPLPAPPGTRKLA